MEFFNNVINGLESFFQIDVQNRKECAMKFVLLALEEVLDNNVLCINTNHNL